MPLGVLFAVATYTIFSICDAIIKGLGPSVGVHEIAFFTAVYSLIPAIVAKPRGERWRDLHKMRHPFLVHLRGVSGLVGNMLVIYAFVTIPLAETYSLAFLAPIFIVVISIFALGEKVSWTRIFFLVASFLGVLLVVRPGFRDLQLGHLAAVVAAFVGSITTVVLRKVAPVEKRVSLMGVALGYVIIVNGIWMIPTFEMPGLYEMILMIIIGLMGGTGNLLFIAAMKRVEASKVAPFQYSQIFWAIVLGAIFYHEYPDAIAYVGLGVVVLFGILNVLSDETRIRIFSRLIQTGAGPATAASEVAPPIDDETKR
jgi:drug/metabolite transporter (DMT)-like permease